MPKDFEPKVLEYGILGAAVLRAIFIRTHPDKRAAGSSCTDYCA